MNTDVERVLAKVVEIGSAAVHSVYVLGSHATGKADIYSDIDITVVFLEEFSSTCSQLSQLISSSISLLEVNVDLVCVPYQLAVSCGLPLLPPYAALLWGEDIRVQIALPKPDLLSAAMYHVAFNSLSRLYPRGHVFNLPLLAPNPGAWGDGWLVEENHTAHPLKPFVKAVDRVAQARVASRIGEYIHRQGSDVAKAYTTYIGDEGATFVENISRIFRMRWRNRYPAEAYEVSLMIELIKYANLFFSIFLEEYYDNLVYWLKYPDASYRHLARQAIIRIRPQPAVRADS